MPLPLCHGDPLVATLRDVLGANLLRVPEARIRPLAMLASDGHRTSFRGSLAAALAGGGALDVPVEESAMPDVAGRRTRAVGLELGVRILEGFLRALHVPTTGIEATLHGASRVAFTFREPKRAFVEPNALGRALAGRALDRANPAASIFFDHGWSALVVDSAIASRDFGISVESDGGREFALDLPAISRLVADAGVEVEVRSTSGTDLVFRGESWLTYAFTCVRLRIAEDGRIAGMPPAREVPGFAGAGAGAEAGAERRVLLTAEPALVEVEMAEAVTAR